MSAATKKPLPGTVGAGGSPISSPVRQPAARSSTPTGGASPSPVSRTRSVRTGTPVSARAAAASSRRESPLSSSAAAVPNTAADPADHDSSRAETVAALDDLKERLARAETSSEQHRKQAEVLQARLDDALREQAQLEERLHEAEEQIESLRGEKRDVARQMREMEAIYEAERSAITKEKEAMANREEEMQTIIQRLKDSLAQRQHNDDEQPRPSRQANGSPSLEGGNFAPPSSLQRSDSRNNSKLILQKDKLIESLRLELAEAQIKLVESENQGGGRLQEVERLLMEARMANARLMEDNESYQLLLQEKTLHGDFGKGDFSYMSGGTSANQDALNALEGRVSSSSGPAPGHRATPSLADELSEVNDDSTLATGGEASADDYRRLEAELRSQKDQNKALTLYINKIIERLLQHQEFEHILDAGESGAGAKGPANTNKDLPPPPPDKSGPSFLQRAKSIAVGASAGRTTRPRPMSVMGQPTAAAAGNTDPVTAPSIPIGNLGGLGNLTRSSSTRRARPMSEQFSGAGGAGAGAGLVSQMYKGSEGPASPGLGGLRGSQTFFLPGAGGARDRVPSSSGTTPSAGNFPGMRSETSSTSGDSADLVTPPSQSPPRPTAASTGAAGDGKATTSFAGGKPRPLRLVQENPDAVKDNAAANKRNSWIGWAQSWTKKEEPGSGGSEAIPE